MENDDVPAPAPAMTRQQICAALGVSESTIRRLEHAGLPHTPVGVRSKRYDLAECKAWLCSHYRAAAAPTLSAATNEKWKGDKDFVAACERAQRRMGPLS